MITTPQQILSSVSYLLGESTTDVSNQRLDFFYNAYQKLLSEYLWSFKVKKYSLTATDSTEYLISDYIDDYDYTNGIKAILHDGKPIPSTTFEDGVNDTSGEEKYYLSLDKKSLLFTAITSGDTYDIYYYAVLKKPSSETDTLNIPIPELVVQPLISYITFLIFNRKRQRYDARNAILDYRQLLEEAIVKDSNPKTKGGFPKTFKPINAILGLDTKYDA